VQVAPLERPMANAVCSMLSPNSRGSRTDCASRKSSAVRAEVFSNPGMSLKHGAVENFFLVA
jgi:hypothetical protein